MFLKQMTSISFPIKHTEKSNILNKFSKFYSFFSCLLSVMNFQPSKKKATFRKCFHAFDDGNTFERKIQF